MNKSKICKNHGELTPDQIYIYLVESISTAVNETFEQIKIRLLACVCAVEGSCLAAEFELDKKTNEKRSE